MDEIEQPATGSANTPITRWRTPTGLFWELVPANAVRAELDLPPLTPEQVSRYVAARYGSCASEVDTCPPGQELSGPVRDRSFPQVTALRDF